MYMVTLNELKASSQARQSGAVNKTSVESTAQDYGFREVKRRKRHIFNNNSQPAKKSANPVPTSAAVSLPPKVMLTRNIFAALRTIDMCTETISAENTLLEQEAPRKQGRRSLTIMTSTTNFIRLQSDLKDFVKGEYEFRNTRNGTRIITKEMADYSAMKSYLEKNNLHYIIFSPGSEKPIKAVIRHLPSDTPSEDISNSLEDLRFNVINVRQMTANRKAPNRQTQWNPSLYSLLLNKKHKISRDIQAE
jgi:hypothetical protein